MDISKIATHNVQNTNTKKLKTVGSGGGKFSLGKSTEAAQITTPFEVRLVPIDALFLNLDQRRKGHKQAIEKSDQILNQLDSLRLGIISGSISKETLENIAALLQHHSQTIMEEPLRTLILEVETRAKVELAKLEKLNQVK